MNQNYSGDFELLTVASRFIGEAIAVAFTQKRAELVFAARSAIGLAQLEQVLHPKGEQSPFNLEKHPSNLPFRYH